MSACHAVLIASCVVMRRGCVVWSVMESVSVRQLLCAEVRAVETTCVCHEDEMESASAHQLLSRVCMYCENNVKSAYAMKTRWKAILMECRRGGVA